MRSPGNWATTFAPALALLGLGLHAAGAHGSRPGSETVLTAAPAATELCEYRTINYITHTVPQQCLRTSWTSPTSTATDDATGQPTATTTATATATATTVTESPSAAQDNGTAQEEDRQEELAASAFMSFEEWKEMMLRKSGQDPSNIKAHKQREHRERDPAMNNPDVDSFGEEGEISLDFDALNEKVSEIASSTGEAVPDADKEAKEEQVFYDDGKTQYYRSKDAGKTCKERFSYASFDAGATVLKTSPRAKNAKAILVENKDSYMLLECRAKTKFVIVELSDDILVDTVVIANFEFFSSMVRTFSISVSDRYPVKLDKWVNLGTFEARNSRDIQAFLIEHPQIYTKYIRIEFLTHWGNEFYCPVSLLRVHGTRMLDTWKEPSHDDEPELIQDSAHEPAAETPQVRVQEPAGRDNLSVVAEEVVQEVVHEVVAEMGLTPWQPVFHSNFSLEMCALRSPTTTEPTPVKSGFNKSHKQPDGGPDGVTPRPSAGSGAEEGSRPSSSPSEPVSPEAPVSGQTTSTAAAAASAPPQAGNENTAGNPSHKQADARADSGDASATTTTTARNKTSSASSASASPTVQESFFKTMTKRLQLLESNTSLSLQYIEEQSRFLQDVLLKMERKQISRVDVFLDNLNKTVLTELRNVRTQYDQIWQSTVLALETQREQSQREIVALTSRLNILADEVVFQKRMAILQSVLLLSCLVLVIFSRGGLAALDSASFPPTSANSDHRRYGYTYGHARSESLSGMSMPSSSPQGGAYQTVADRTSLAGSALPRHLYPTGSSAPAPVSFKDKSLPLTPPSEYSRENTPSAAATAATKARQLHHSPESSFYEEQVDEDQRRQHQHQNQPSQNHSSTGPSGAAQTHHQGPMTEPSNASTISISPISTFDDDHHGHHSPQSQSQSQADTATTTPPPQREGQGSRRDGPQEGQEDNERDGRSGEEEQDQDQEHEHEQEKPPLLRARSTMSQQLGASGLRKPLPALPEDPS
jgi:hypothetical protein